MRFATVVLAVLLAATPALADKPVPPPGTSPVPATGQPASFSVEMHMVSDGQDMLMKRTVDGPKTRMDMSSKGMTQTIIMLGDEKQTTLMIDPTGKRAMKMSSKEAMERPKDAPAPSGKPSLKSRLPRATGMSRSSARTRSTASRSTSTTSITARRARARCGSIRRTICRCAWKRRT